MINPDQDAAASEAPVAVHVPTLIALSLVAYAVSNVVHEGLGHGLGCVVAGGKPLALNAVYFEGDYAGVTAGGRKLAAAGGTVMNLVLAGVAALGLRGARQRRGALAGFLWLLLAVNLLQGTGYWLFSGLMDIGDWSTVIAGLGPRWLWRGGLALVGAAGYMAAVHVSLRALVPLLGAADNRVALAWRWTVIPYLSGGALYLIAGLRNPIGLLLVLISAAAASLGGTSALCWMANLLRDERNYPRAAVAPLALPPSRPWLLASAVAVLVFVGLLGPGVRLTR